MKELTDQALNDKAAPVSENKLEPADFITLKERKSQDDAVKVIGEQSLRDGKVSAFLVAGGQGTRLGFDGPKGMYPVSPVRKKCLFQMHAENLLAIGNKFGKSIPWYIMTSQTNNQITKDSFEENEYFGYDKKDGK
jgi:UDP-N-acetylglucosamine/UDP-N-acetylgalactosamine diphosphorylase